MAIPEETEPWSECIDVETGRLSRLDVGNAIGNREGNLLDRSRSRFSNVIARD